MKSLVSLKLKSVLISMSLLSFTATATGAELNPKDIPNFEDARTVDSLITETNSSKTGDTTYASLALLRCSLLIAIMETYLGNSGKKADIADEKKLNNNAIFIKAQRMVQQNDKLTFEEALDKANDEVSEQSPYLIGMYINRIKSNQMKTGDSWASDDKLSGEIDTCKQLSSAFN